MTKHKPTITVVIPAHNEEMHIKACLDSLMDQTVAINQIIVVSNASTDKTSQIARQFSTVLVIDIAKKGITNARDAGFNKAKCDIIARLNADVICAPDWSERLIKDFSNTSVSAVAGVARAMLIPIWPYFYTSFWSRIYLLMAEAYFGVPMLWGANMAIRRTAWEKIAKSTCLSDSDVHEDQDISIHLISAGERIIKDSKLIVKTQEKSYFSWDKFKRYNQLRIKTKSSHLSLIKSSKKLQLSLPQRLARLVFAGVPTVIFTLASLGVMVTQKLTRYLTGRHR